MKNEAKRRGISAGALLAGGLHQINYEPKPATKTITYYAVAINPAGQIAQLLVTRVMAGPGICVFRKQEWTGVTYRNEREVEADIRNLNGCRA